MTIEFLIAFILHIHVHDIQNKKLFLSHENLKAKNKLIDLLHDQGFGQKY